MYMIILLFFSPFVRTMHYSKFNSNIFNNSINSNIEWHIQFGGERTKRPKTISQHLNGWIELYDQLQQSAYSNRMQ